MFLSFLYILIIFSQLLQNFYIAFSQFNIRTRNKISAGALVIRGRNILSARTGLPKFFEIFRKKISHCRKLSHSAEKCHAVPKKSQSIYLYIDIETNYNLFFYITEGYCLSSYMHPLS